MVGGLALLFAASAMGCGPSITGRACDASDPCPTHFACVPAHDGVTRCMRECDLSETVCQDGTVCLPLGGSTGFACYLGGNTPVGGTCTSDLDCTRDALCVHAGSLAQCFIGCNLDGTHRCNGGFACLPLAGGRDGFCSQTM